VYYNTQAVEEEKESSCHYVERVVPRDSFTAHTCTLPGKIALTKTDLCVNNIPTGTVSHIYIGLLNLMIYEGLERPLQLNSLCVCLYVLPILRIF